MPQPLRLHFLFWQQALTKLLHRWPWTPSITQTLILLFSCLSLLCVQTPCLAGSPVVLFVFSQLLLMISQSYPAVCSKPGGMRAFLDSLFELHRMCFSNFLLFYVNLFKHKRCLGQMPMSATCIKTSTLQNCPWTRNTVAVCLQKTLSF